VNSGPPHTRASGVDALTRLAAGLSEAAGAPVELDRPNDSAHGDYATNVALRVAAQRRRPPRELAAEFAEAAEGLDGVAHAEVAGPGFVNVTLTDKWYAQAVGEILAEPGWAAGPGIDPERVQVELVSANPTGPVTVGSARNAAYGDAVARLLELRGHQVEREYYFNDGGRQVDAFRASVEAVRSGGDAPEDGYRGAYVAELAKAGGDPVALMMSQIRETLERFRVRFDSFQLERELEPEIPAAVALLDTYEAEGTLWARTSAHGDDKDRPLVRSSDGSYLYFAYDVAYLRHKLERYDRAVYVLGADHHGYVNRLKAAAAMMGYDPERVEVLIYQLVHVTSGGEATKVSKRRGDVVFLDDLIDEIGVDAARWYLVSRGHDQTIEIDLDLAAEKSQKNPVYYVQYAHARIAGILRNAGERPPGEITLAEPLQPEERALVKRLLELPGLVAESAERRAPHAIPTYAIRVADDFHRFYHDRKKRKVVGSEQESFRLALCRATQRVVGQSLELIGVEAPDRM
jgi:arginyl-tRNA synthetase